ncbi:MAG: hypothetical protein AB7G88_09200 [Thermomicrobiales bacterium]
MTRYETDPGHNELTRSEQEPTPARAPTTREKISVLLPALIAFGGMVLMLVIFLMVAALKN